VTHPGLDALRLRLDTLAWTLGRDEALDPAALRALLSEAEALAPALDAAGRAALHQTLCHLHTAVADARARLGDRIGSMGAGRRALKGYAHALSTPPPSRFRRRA
jgi:hypothetical protein